MSMPERIYALLVEANPVPDPDELLVVPRVHDTEPRRPTMQIEKTMRTAEPPPPQRRRPWIPALAAAAIVAVAVAAGAIWLAAADDETAPAVTDPPATTVADLEPEPDAQARAETAVGKAQAFFAALNGGDLAAIEALVAPNEQIDLADQRLFAFNAAFATTYGLEVRSCEATDTANSLFVRVDCIVVDGDPVFAALGVGAHTWPWQVFDAGRMGWLPAEGADLRAVTDTYADYLTARHAAEYAEACQPAAYEPGSVVVNGRLALTGACGELAASLAPDVAAWVRAGSPDLTAAGEEEGRVEAAVTTVEALMAAIAVGDLDAIADLTSPDGTPREADRRMWEFNAAGFAEHPIAVQGCTEVPTTPGDDVVRVACRVVDSNPVAVAVGLEETDWPYLVYDDGRVEWRPTEPGLAPLARAYADYMRANDPDGYQEACSPSAYVFGRINSNGNLALTAECAALVLPITDDVAAWVLAGRPES